MSPDEAYAARLLALASTLRMESAAADARGMHGLAGVLSDAEASARSWSEAVTEGDA